MCRSCDSAYVPENAPCRMCSSACTPPAAAHVSASYRMQPCQRQSSHAASQHVSVRHCMARARRRHLDVAVLEVGELFGVGLDAGVAAVETGVDGELLAEVDLVEQPHVHLAPHLVQHPPHRRPLVVHRLELRFQPVHFVALVFQLAVQLADRRLLAVDFIPQLLCDFRHALCLFLVAQFFLFQRFGLLREFLVRIVHVLLQLVPVQEAAPLFSASHHPSGSICVASP
eukprot:1492032-Rhodomonas_salina.1